MKIVIFNINGTTHLFQGVTNFEEGEDVLMFDYYGESLQENRSAVIYKDKILGYSIYGG